MASLVGQDVSNGLIAETDEEAAQRFISQQIFSVPDGHSQTQVFLETLGLIFRHGGHWGHICAVMVNISSFSIKYGVWRCKIMSAFIV